METPAAERYLTPGEAARLLHVSSKTVNRWANEGRIACIVTLGGHRRFRPADVQAVADRMAGKEESPPAVEEAPKPAPRRKR
jgi:excisionase family DNA binding protein